MRALPTSASARSFPYNSPIQNSGLLFYNTLFDENAACHLALGMGFADTIKNFENYTLDECRAKASTIHGA